MASFASIDQSLECAIAIQRVFAAYNIQNSGAPLHLRIGLSGDEPVEDDNDCSGGRCNWLPKPVHTQNRISPRD
jgi:hypothetical protein